MCSECPVTHFWTLIEWAKDTLLATQLGVVRPEHIHSDCRAWGEQDGMLPYVVRFRQNGSGLLLLSFVNYQHAMGPLFLECVTFDVQSIAQYIGIESCCILYSFCLHSEMSHLGTSFDHILFLLLEFYLYSLPHFFLYLQFQLITAFILNTWVEIKLLVIKGSKMEEWEGNLLIKDIWVCWWICRDSDTVSS